MDFFGSLGRKKAPKYPLNATAPPRPHPTNAAPHFRAMGSDSRRQTNHTKDTRRRPLDTPFKSDGPKDIRLHRSTANHAQYNERQFHSSTFMDDDKFHDIEEERANQQAKMEHIDQWRRDAHGIPEPFSERHYKRDLDGLYPSSRKLDPPIHVKERQRADHPDGQGSDRFRGSSSDAFNAFEWNGLQGKRKATPKEMLSSTRSPYGSSGTRAKSKSTTFLIETGPPATADTVHLLYPKRMQRMYCFKCKALPPAGTTCIHGVPGTVAIR